MNTNGAISQAIDDLLSRVDTTHFSPRQKQSVKASLQTVQKLTIAQSNPQVLIRVGQLVLAFQGLIDEGSRPDFDTEDLLHKLKFASIQPTPSPAARTPNISVSSQFGSPHGYTYTTPSKVPQKYSPVSITSSISRHQGNEGRKPMVDDDGSDSEFDDDEPSYTNQSQLSNPFVSKRMSMASSMSPNRW